MREPVVRQEQVPRALPEAPAVAPSAPALASVLALQRTAGNAAVGAWLRRQIRFLDQQRPPTPVGARREIEEWLGATTLNPRQLEELDTMLVERGEPHDYRRVGGQQRFVADLNDRIATAEVAALMRRPRAVDFVIVQGDYMSGDRYGIASAIVVGKDLTTRIKVLVAHATESAGAATELTQFYRLSGRSEAAADLLPVNDPAVFYRKFRTLHPQDKFIKTATFGTEFIKRASEFAKGQDDSGGRKIQSALVANWFGDRKNVEEKDQLLLGWLTKDMGLVPGKYAFLWVKTGAMSAEKSHHFTSKPAWAKLIARIRDETGRVPVLVGQDIGLRTDPYFGEFWNHPGFPPSIKAEGRIGQLRVFNLLASHRADYDVVNVGMRSGAIEGPALVGLPTIYLEESGNQQSERMEKWLRSLPNYFRVIIDRPPGGAHLRAWLRDQIDDVRRQAQATKDQRKLRELETWLDRGVDDILAMSLYEGLSNDESTAIVALLKKTSKQLLTGHDDLGKTSGRYRFANRPGDKVPEFDAAGRDDSQNVPVRVYGLLKTWLRAPGTRGTLRRVPAEQCIVALTTLLNRVVPHSSAQDWEAIPVTLANARACYLTGPVALGHPTLGAALREARQKFAQMPGELRSRRRQEIKAEVADWFVTAQAGFVSPNQNAPRLLTQLVQLLEDRPATQDLVTAKWIAIERLLPQLTADNLPGEAALADYVLGRRLDMAADQVRSELLEFDLLPPPIVQPPIVVQQAPVIQQDLVGTGKTS